MGDWIKKIWLNYYCYIIPSIATIIYFISLVLLHYEKVNFFLMQESCYFINALEVVVTFVSIILSVFGVLLPAFLGEKGKSKTMEYFFKYVDRREFSKCLKNVVANGLMVVFITCILFLKDIFYQWFCNLVILIWVWLLISFMCSSYRYISIIISLLIVEKEEFELKTANEVSDEEKRIIKENVPKI